MRRPRFQINLRTLLVGMVLLCCGLGWVGRERLASAREQASALRLAPAGVRLDSESSLLNGFVGALLGERVTSADIYIRDRREGGLFRDPLSDLNELLNFPRLKKVFIETDHVSDLSPLAKLPELEYVYVASSSCSEQEVAKLRKACPGCVVDFEE